MTRPFLNSLVLTAFFGIVATDAHAGGKWLLGLEGHGQFYAEHQKAWDDVLQSNGLAFDDKFKSFYGGQLEFYSVGFPARFTIGARVDYVKESATDGNITAKSSAYLIQFIDTFYFGQFKNGFNGFVRLGAGYMLATGSQTINSTNSAVNFSGNFFTGSASLGIEYLLLRVAIDLEVGYRYAKVPKTVVTSASGSTYSGLTKGDTFAYSVNGGAAQKFTLDYSGVFYGVALKIYF